MFPCQQDIMMHLFPVNVYGEGAGSLPRYIYILRLKGRQFTASDELYIIAGLEQRRNGEYIILWFSILHL